METSNYSVDDIKAAMRSKSPRDLDKMFDILIRSVINERREDVKAFLIELIEQNDKNLASSAYGWITNYNDETVLSFLLNKSMATKADIRTFYALEGMVLDGFFTPRSRDIIIKTMIELLPKEDPHPCYLPIMRMLAELDAIESLDVIARYIDHDIPAVRHWAISCALRLAKSANRRDVAEKAKKHLQDSARAVRLQTALSLKSFFPEEFGHLVLDPDNP